MLFVVLVVYKGRTPKIMVFLSFFWFSEGRSWFEERTKKEREREKERKRETEREKERGRAES